MSKHFGKDQHLDFMEGERASNCNQTLDYVIACYIPCILHAQITVCSLCGLYTTDADPLRPTNLTTITITISYYYPWLICQLIYKPAR